LDLVDMNRNQLCPCGSGKKLKKCCGAAGKQAQATPSARATISEGTAAPVVSDDLLPDHPASLFRHSGRKASEQQAEDERKKHLRRRSQASELRGTLVYNSGSAFRDQGGR
jgi:hypothetical protein